MKAPKLGNLEKLRTIGVRAVILVFAAYAAAAVFSSFVTGLLLTRMEPSKGRAKGKKTAGSVIAATGTYNIRASDKLNYVTMRRAVLGRNVFNSKGEFPEEVDPEEEKKTSGDGKFDLDARCEKSTLPLKLVGTIFLGKGTVSYATIKENGYNVADIYRPGDTIIGNETAEIVAITRKKVIINNGGTKECIEVDEKQLATATRSFESVRAPSGPPPVRGPKGPKEGEAPPPSDGGVSECVTLDGGYVEAELGGGFSKIISAARLVPNMENNAVRGFKMFAINRSSILGKAGFKNGDVITQVNDVSLKQPEQGFALYEAFQDEREISVHVLRGGKTPQTLCVKIK